MYILIHFVLNTQSHKTYAHFYVVCNMNILHALLCEQLENSGDVRIYANVCACIFIWCSEIPKNRINRKCGEKKISGRVCNMSVC